MVGIGRFIRRSWKVGIAILAVSGLAVLCLVLWPKEPIEAQAERILQELKSGSSSSLWAMMPDEEKEQNPGLTPEGVQELVQKIVRPALMETAAAPGALASTQAFDRLGKEHLAVSGFYAPLHGGGETALSVSIVQLEGRRTVSLTELVRQAWMSRGAKQKGVPFDRKSFHSAMARGWAQDKAVLERAGFTNLVFIDHGSASITVRDWESHRQVIDREWADWANEPVPST